MKRIILAIITIMSGVTAFAATLDFLLFERGFVDVATISPEMIVVDLMYGRPDNFVGEIMYTPADGPTKAWLHPDAAAALGKAVTALRQERPDLRLKVCDASRPMSVQRKMYATVRRTPKAPYVSNPANGGGLHNYGLAVDITLCDSTGRELPMGTPVDFLGPEANIDKEDLLVKQGKITTQERANRQLLRRIMKSAGFRPLRSEWWHFNLVSRATARARYKVIDF